MSALPGLRKPRRQPVRSSSASKRVTGKGRKTPVKTLNWPPQWAIDKFDREIGGYLTGQQLTLFDTSPEYQ